MDTLISVSFGIKIPTGIFWVEIWMNMDQFVRVGISAQEIGQLFAIVMALMNHVRSAT